MLATGSLAVGFVANYVCQNVAKELSRNKFRISVSSFPCTRMGGGLPTDGKAEPRMNTFDGCGFEMHTVNFRSMSLSKGPWSRKGPPAFHPQFDFVIRGNCQALADSVCRRIGRSGLAV